MNRIVSQNDFTIDLERVASMQITEYNKQYFIEVQYNGKTEFVWHPDKQELVERIIADKVTKLFQDYEQCSEAYKALRDCWEMYL